LYYTYLWGKKIYLFAFWEFEVFILNWFQNWYYKLLTRPEFICFYFTISLCRECTFFSGLLPPPSTPQRRILNMPTVISFVIVCAIHFAWKCNFQNQNTCRCPRVKKDHSTEHPQRAKSDRTQNSSVLHPSSLNRDPTRTFVPRSSFFTLRFPLRSTYVCFARFPELFCYVSYLFKIFNMISPLIIQ